jgi:hypothetical protein
MLVLHLSNGLIKSAGINKTTYNKRIYINESVGNILECCGGIQ